MSEKEKLSDLITYLYETMNGELALDYVQLDGKNIEILLKHIERLHSIIKEVREKIENTTINCEGVAEDLIDNILEILDKVDKDSDK